MGHTPRHHQRKTVQAEKGERHSDQLRADDVRSFVPLYRHYKHRVYAYCYRLLRHPQNAEDATQETFIKIHRSLSQLDNAGSLRAWVFAIARNEAYTILRRQRPIVELEDENEDIWDEEDPLERMARQERAGIVQHCLSLLKPRYRELLILREYEELSYSEISRITGATESAIKSGLFKARRAMERKLESILRERKES